MKKRKSIPGMRQKLKVKFEKLTYTPTKTENLIFYYKQAFPRTAF